MPHLPRDLHRARELVWEAGEMVLNSLQIQVGFHQSSWACLLLIWGSGMSITFPLVLKQIFTF